MSNIGHVDVECPVCGNTFPIFLQASTPSTTDSGDLIIRIVVDHEALAEAIDEHRDEHHAEQP